VWRYPGIEVAPSSAAWRWSLPGRGDRGRSGFSIMWDDWLEDNVYDITVRPDDVREEIQDILERPATVLPACDPMW